MTKPAINTIEFYLEGESVEVQLVLLASVTAFPPIEVGAVMRFSPTSTKGGMININPRSKPSWFIVSRYFVDYRETSRGVLSQTLTVFLKPPEEEEESIFRSSFLDQPLM